MEYINTNTFESINTYILTNNINAFMLTTMIVLMNFNKMYIYVCRYVETKMLTCMRMYMQRKRTSRLSSH